MHKVKICTRRKKSKNKEKKIIYIKSDGKIKDSIKGVMYIRHFETESFLMRNHLRKANSVKPKHSQKDNKSIKGRLWFT